MCGCCCTSTGIPDAIESIRAVADASSLVMLPFLQIMQGVPAYAEIAAKWTLNCISTAAQIAKVRVVVVSTCDRHAALTPPWRVHQGCVYTNRMINVGVLNNKLFFRAINLVRQFARADYETGEARAGGDNSSPSQPPTPTLPLSAVDANRV